MDHRASRVQDNRKQQASNPNMASNPWGDAKCCSQEQNSIQHFGFESSSFENVTSDRLPDSEAYLKKLETRLCQLKGKSLEPISKDMLTILQKVREDHMNRLVQVDVNNCTSSSFLPEMDTEDKEMSASYIERRLFPEKNALTLEELQHLLDADVLAKTTSHQNGVKTTTESSVDR